MAGKVYFILTESFNRIKIGYSKNIDKRLKQLQTGQPEKLVLLGLIDGSFKID